MNRAKEASSTVHTRRRRHRKHTGRVRHSLPAICLGFLFSAVCFAACASKTDAVPIASLEPAELPAALATPPENSGSVSLDDWRLLLVNRWNPIPDGYTFELEQLDQGHAIDSRAYPDLQEMMDACRAAGLDPRICSSYRTQAKQRELYENKIHHLICGPGGRPGDDGAGSVPGRICGPAFCAVSRQKKKHLGQFGCPRCYSMLPPHCLLAVW